MAQTDGVFYVYENAGPALGGASEKQAVAYVYENAGAGLGGRSVVGRVLAQVLGDKPAVLYAYENVT